MLTKEHGKSFKEYIFDNVPLLTESIAWIKESLKPEDVFDKVKLDQWAQENGYARSVVKSEANETI